MVQMTMTTTTTTTTSPSLTSSTSVSLLLLSHTTTDKEKQQQEQCRRRKDIASCVYKLWTRNGSDLSGLAPPLVDGRIDTISYYVLLDIVFEENNEEINSNEEDFKKERDNVTSVVSSSHVDDDDGDGDEDAIRPVVQERMRSTCTKNTIDRIHCDDLSYDDFVSKYMRRNIPVLIQGLTDNWKAKKEWVVVTDDNDNDIDSDGINNNGGVPNISYLRTKFGTSVSTVMEQESYGFDGVLRRPISTEMTVSAYMDWWEQYHQQYKKKNKMNGSSISLSNTNTTNINGSDKLHHHQNNNNNNNNNNQSYKRDDIMIDSTTIISKSKMEQSNLEASSTSVPLLYLKDWKFVASYPEYGAYECPVYFRDDWLNDAGTYNINTNDTNDCSDDDNKVIESTSALGNAYKFVYIGPAGTSTILHADVIRSYSWSTNVCGTKRWYLIPPAYTYLLYDTIVFGGTTLATHIHLDIHSSGLQLFYPGLQYVRKYFCIEIIQNAGETIYVPTNWFHTVENIEPTLSINHNWINGTNIISCWNHIESEIRSFRIPKKMDQVNNNVESNCTEQDASIGSAPDDKRYPNDSKGQDNNSFVDDEVKLLWHVISKKATSILMLKIHHQNNNCTSMNDNQTDDTMPDRTKATRIQQTKSDIKVILYILDGMQSLIQDGICPALEHETGPYLEDIQKRLDSYLSYLLNQ